MRNATKNKPAKANTNQQSNAKKQSATIEQPADLFFSMLNEMLCAEKQIIAALPKIIELASAQDLKSSLSEHLRQTEGQRDRLTQVIQMMSRQEQAADCKTVQNLLQEGQRKAEKVQRGQLRDLAIIGACLKVEYFEMSAYRSLVQMADMLDMDQQADLLGQTFNEEMNAAKTLSQAASQMDLKQAAAEHIQPQSQGAVQSLPRPEAEHQKEKESMRGSERERDSQGRFTSDDDDRGYRSRDYNRGGRDDDDDRPGWRGDPQGHSEAARKGWQNREGGGRYDDDDRGGYFRGGRGGSDDEGRGWYGDPRGHSEAAREGWRNREGGSSRSRYDDDDRDYNRGSRYGHGGWFGDPQGHAEASREGWRTREREGTDTYDEGNRPGWYGDPRGHSEAAREGWRDREGYSRSRSRDYDDDRDYNRGSRYRSDDNEGRGWYGDPRGHSEAAREGWRHREGGGRSSSRDYGDDRSYSSRGRSGDDDDERGWYGDPRGHSEAARKG